MTASTAAPTGTLMKKIHSQPNALVNAPPSSTPAAAPLPETAPQMPSARFRSFPSSNVVVRIDSAAGETSAAPRPCSERNAISDPSDHASPSSSELTVKSASPAMNSRRRPSRSAIRPPSRSMPPNRIEYAVTTHCRLSWLNCRSVLIVGSATFTIATSSTTMNCAVTITASPIQRRRSGWSGCAMKVGFASTLIAAPLDSSLSARGSCQTAPPGCAAHYGVQAFAGAANRTPAGGASSAPAAPAASAATTAPPTASRKKWLPVATITSSTRAG